MGRMGRAASFGCAARDGAAASRHAIAMAAMRAVVGVFVMHSP